LRFDAVDFSLVRFGSNFTACGQFGLLDGDDAAVEGDGDGLGAVATAKLGEDVAGVNAHGAFADGELGGDLFIRLAIGDEFENFEFAGAELGASDSLGEAGGDFLRQRALACMHSADGVD
jgi:hypothetical protein